MPERRETRDDYEYRRRLVADQVRQAATELRRVDELMMRAKLAAARPLDHSLPFQGVVGELKEIDLAAGVWAAFDELNAAQANYERHGRENSHES